METFTDYCGVPLKVQLIKSLTKNEKYLFGVISDNATEQGIWIISDEFLTVLFRVSSGSIAKRIYSLEREGVISSTLEKENKKYVYTFKILFPFIESVIY